MSLTVLCVTRAEAYAWPFLRDLEDLAAGLDAQLVIGADGPEAKAVLCEGPVAGRIVPLQSQGYIESVLDEAIAACDGDYVLRLDDDERCSPALVQWLQNESYLEADHWKFPRAHFWGDDQSVIVTLHLWPDVQTRLSVKAKAGGQRFIHAGSPFGGGAEAPVYMEHHKFLVKSYDERRAIAERYDAVRLGYGTGGMLPFSLPEDAYETAKIVARGDGSVPWNPVWSKEIRMRVPA
jgi:hypothetical protein